MTRFAILTLALVSFVPSPSAGQTPAFPPTLFAARPLTYEDLTRSMHGLLNGLGNVYAMPIEAVLTGGGR